MKTMTIMMMTKRTTRMTKTTMRMRTRKRKKNVRAAKRANPKIGSPGISWMMTILNLNSLT